MVCPSCLSNDLKKLSLIYMAGSYERKGRSRGIVFSAEGVGAYRARNRSTHESKLSKVAAPPKKWAIVKPLLYGVVGAFCLVLVPLKGQAWNLLFAVCCVAVVVYLLAALLHNMRRYPEALRSWESSFMCQRCGTIVSDATKE
jgi:hypothetical protein